MYKRQLDCLAFSLDKGNDWKKSDLRKVAIATRLEMGHENSINRDIRKGKTDAKPKSSFSSLKKCSDAWTDPNGTLIKRKPGLSGEKGKPEKGGDWSVVTDSFHIYAVEIDGNVYSDQDE